ncbi:rhodanese-like domain-containing protein [Pararhodobacter oceanensis]|uniref:Rhodanese n=1 Tax=Pararhodobacter oceanensis TaxID=2172121 RepID=A0A2T8HUM8_9RHOB|nr:rhodanese-like domain-containing protein [Pararhodobacter oceanensis]PVH29160.1 rhodanese [Pararhodobacter oceanensis]
MKRVKDMVAEANTQVRHAPAAELHGMLGQEGVTFVDLRDPRELEREGMIPGAFHCPRGMLEFWIDPESPYAKERFQSGDTLVFYCASGWRSALSAKVAQDMGLAKVMHISDGFSGWRESGGAVGERPVRK